MNADGPEPIVPAPRHRILMGVFDTLPALEAAVDGLAMIGVTRSNLILVTGHSHPDSLTDRIARGEGNANTRKLRRQDRKGNTPRVSRLPFAMQGLLSGPFETWGAAGTTGRLNAQLDRGGCVLVTLADQTENERDVLKILLAHSIDQVQQHDVIPPANG